MAVSARMFVVCMWGARGVGGGKGLICLRGAELCVRLGSLTLLAPLASPPRGPQHAPHHSVITCIAGVICTLSRGWL